MEKGRAEAKASRFGHRRFLSSWSLRGSANETVPGGADKAKQTGQLIKQQQQQQQQQKKKKKKKKKKKRKEEKEKEKENEDEKRGSS
ncbi:hypothetical protein TWF481_005614 [Arthrobotrys musiformis]|uniref:Uncharacterized protein n=1 Tax=Arthrobotrys musiformis TaxID=47236 RepID=A0AAV9WE75_9PEZI